MSRTTIPNYRRHRATGQALVTLTDDRGRRRDFYLGCYGTEESKALYDKTVAEWISTGRTRLPGTTAKVATERRTIRDLIGRHASWAKTYYRHEDRTPTGEADVIERACTLLAELFGDEDPRRFTPSKLRKPHRGWLRHSSPSPTGQLERARSPDPQRSAVEPRHGAQGPVPLTPAPKFRKAPSSLTRIPAPPAEPSGTPRTSRPSDRILRPLGAILSAPPYPRCPGARFRGFERP